MIRNRYNQIPHPALKTEREITKYINWQQFTVIQLPKSTKYFTNIIAEPKYKYGHQEQVTVRNHNRSTALERSVLKYGGGLNRFYGYTTLPSASVIWQEYWIIGTEMWNTKQNYLH